MPIAQKESSEVARFCHLLPKPPGGFAHGQLSPNLVHNTGAIFSGAEGQACLPQLAHIASNLSENGSPDARGATGGQFFSTHSPPILNLSPNLSPTTETSQRNSPAYDLRQTTVRRRSMQEHMHNRDQQVQHHQPHYYSGIIAEDGQKSESPCRKRRKVSQQSIIDLTASPSPPPSMWQSEASYNNTYQSPRIRRNSANQRRGTSEQRCNTPRARRSPQLRRRVRERHIQNESPERRAFQPLGSQPRPTVISQQQQQQQQQQQPAIEPMAVSNAGVGMTSYGLPMGATPHYMPLCTTTHFPLGAAQPLRSMPGCAVPIPTCSGMHMPMCGLQQIPVTQALHPYLQAAGHAHPHYTSHPMMQQPHLPTQPQFVAAQHPVQAREEELHMMGEQQRVGQFPHIPPTLPRGPTIHATPPVYLQEPAVYPQPHDIHNPFNNRLRRGSSSRSRWRSSIPPPPPPYPGFLLHFLAMLGNPPVPPYGMDPNNEASEVENYEALLNLAERLGEAKPKGLQKVEIEQLPKYYYNAEGRKSTMDQTSCVVCMCDFENQQKLRVLPCSHEFHAKCVDKWLKANRTCPICRADASEGIGQSE